jgi:TldD protein
MELLRAPECPRGTFPVIIGPNLLGLHLHETGHGLEGDRFEGGELSFMGTSIFGSDAILPHIGSFRFGSPHLTIEADATRPGGLGTFAVDHEGVRTRRFPLVENGILKNVLVSREWASILNSRFRRQRFEANGVSRSLSYDRAPLVRMPNLTLRPGNQTLRGLIGGIDHGFFLENPYSWSMAPDRGSFQFGAEIAYEIKHGSLGNIVRNPGYAGKTLNFWRSCQGVVDRHAMKAYSIMNCGKGIPAADMRMTNYMVPAAFTAVTLFNRRKFYGGTQC